MFGQEPLIFLTWPFSRPMCISQGFLVASNRRQCLVASWNRNFSGRRRSTSDSPSLGESGSLAWGSSQLPPDQKLQWPQPPQAWWHWGWALLMNAAPTICQVAFPPQPSGPLGARPLAMPLPSFWPFAPSPSLPGAPCSLSFTSAQPFSVVKSNPHAATLIVQADLHGSLIFHVGVGQHM